MLKIYGSMLCPDCVKCCEELKNAQVDFVYCDFADNLLHLKEFLKLRDDQPLFDPVRQNGKIGIPCIVREDGSLTLEWDEFLQ
jgi:glutaredoxin-related protein